MKPAACDEHDLIARTELAPEDRSMVLRHRAYRAACQLDLVWVEQTRE